jgi:hypothetical protein
MATGTNRTATPRETSQHDNQLRVTGDLDPQTLEKLGIDFGNDSGILDRLRKRF